MFGSHMPRMFVQVCDVVAAPGLGLWFFLFSLVTVSDSGWEGWEDAHPAVSAWTHQEHAVHPRSDSPFAPVHYRLDETNRPVHQPLETAMPWLYQQTL